MSIKSSYDTLDNWVRNLPTPQYLILGWLLAYLITLLVTLVITTPPQAAITSVGCATGSTIGMYLIRREESR